jgi:hypothetical protein
MSCMHCPTDARKQYFRNIIINTSEHEVYPGTHFVNGFCNENGKATVAKY